MAKQYKKASENNSEAFARMTGIDGTVPPQATELYERPSAAFHRGRSGCEGQR